LAARDCNAESGNVLVVRALFQRAATTFNIGTAPARLARAAFGR
jgi:hypothetical protein